MAQLNRDNVQALEKVLDLVKANQANGNGTIADVKRVEARLVDAKAVSADTEAGLQNGMDQFRRLVRAEPAELLPAPKYSSFLPKSADLAVEVVRRVLPRSGRVVFVEADLNNVRDQSLWQAIGPFASAAYLQALLFAGVVVWALGRRFGPPLRLGVQARASRELVDAFGNLLSRARRTELACVYLYEHLDHRARRALKLSPLASDKDRDARMPETAVRLLHELKAAGVSGTTLSSRELTRLAKTSLTAIGDLERSARAR
jgi:hypothetical protein